MRFLKNPFAVLEAWFLRRTAFLAHPRTPFRAALLVPLLFGLLSVGLGQDDNWDMKNYHWYNPYALLNGRLDLDMAPGVWQSYFNPLIDLPYYLMSTTLPAPVVGFVMGLVHGLNFVLLLGIARRLLGLDAGRTRLAVLLAAAGTCGAGFLSELGNTMGDNLTALMVLGSLYLLLRGWQDLHAWSGRTVGLLLAAGLVMGLGTGLKLTNATYALALCLSLLAVSLPFAKRLGLAFVYGCGVLGGLLASAGYWWLTMWKQFGNPLFPQFNNIFRSPLALQLGVIDNFHMPHNVLEALFWPFVFTKHFTRVSEIVLKQAVIPALYAIALLFIGVWLAERVSGRRAPSRLSPLSPQARLLLVFGLLSYLGWMKLFGIYRYLVPLELLAPLMIWLLVERMAPQRHAARAGGWLLAITTLTVFPFMTWGHVGWASTSFSAQFPPFARPASTIVFTAHAHPPMGWLATFVPREVRVISLGVGFPETPAYLARIQAAIDARPGPHYVMLATSKNEKEGGLRRKLAAFDALGMTADAEGCARLDRLLHKVRFQVQVKFAQELGRQCTLELQPQYVVDLAAQDRAVLDTARQTLARYGLALDAASCRRYPAAIGSEPYPFTLCQVLPNKPAALPAES
jgi:hypothetical protein